MSKRLRFAAGRDRHVIGDAAVAHLDGESRDRFRLTQLLLAEAGDRCAQHDFGLRVALHPEPPVIRPGRRLLRDERVVVEEIRQRLRARIAAGRRAASSGRDPARQEDRAAASTRSAACRSAPDLVWSPGAQRDVERVQHELRGEQRPDDERRRSPRRAPAVAGIRTRNSA